MHTTFNTSKKPQQEYTLAIEKKIAKKNATKRYHHIQEKKKKHQKILKFGRLPKCQKISKKMSSQRKAMPFLKGWCGRAAVAPGPRHGGRGCAAAAATAAAAAEKTDGLTFVLRNPPRPPGLRACREGIIWSKF